MARAIVVNLRGGDSTVVVGCRGAARDLSRAIGFEPVDQTRIATAVSEIVRDAVQYASSASLTLRQVEAPDRRGLEVIVEDQGPGIDDLERVVLGGCSSSAGLGLGIAGARQLMDEFEIVSAPTEGTRVRMCKWLALPPVPAYPAPVGGAGAGGRSVAVSPREGELAGATTDGLLAVQRGRVVLYPPSGKGRLPTLRAGGHVQALVNGVEVRGLRVVRPGDVIEIRVLHEEPGVELRVEVSQDGLEAQLHVERRSGTRYVLADQPPTSDLTLVAVPAEKMAPAAVSREELMAALKAAGVVYGVDEMALRAVQTSTESGSVVVARGLPASPPEDGRIELHFENAPYVPAEIPEEAARVDPMSLYRVSTVSPGALLATKHAPRPGYPGRRVTGEPIAVDKPRDVALRAGPGTTCDEEERRVYAARGGRPSFFRGVVSVLPLHTVIGDVSPETGHVEFDGDVLVTGNVNESMRVESGGRVMVGGIVSGAQIRAQEGVAIGRGVVRSRVVTGGLATDALRVVAAVRPVHRQVEQLVASVRFFRQQAASKPGVEALDDGPIVMAMLDRKFPGLVRLVEGLLSLSEQAAVVDGGLADLVSTLYRSLTARTGRERVSVDDLAACSLRLEGLLDRLAALQGYPADVMTRYVHNAEVRASGVVRIPSGSCHYARIRAGKGFVMESGVFRGDEIVVSDGDVVLDKVGSPSGTNVWIEVVEKGEVAARQVYPGVTVVIGGRRHDFLAEAWAVRVRPTDAGPLDVASVAPPRAEAQS